MTCEYRKPVTTGLVSIIAFLSLSSLALTQTALAQTQADAADASADAPADNVAEVQITGSRIVREGYTTPTPVQAIGVQELQDSSRANIGETLNTLPVFQGSLTPASSQQGIAQNTQTEMNLRNLGANRTLVLFDGRRLPSSNIESVPNVALIPDGLISRVDVVTGGASAVYGSDAMSGVVNFILDTNFTGIKGLVQGGISGYGDGPSEKTQITIGTTAFGGRVHILLSGDQNYQSSVLGTDRPWNVTGVGTINNPAYSASSPTGSKVPQFLAAPCCVATTYPTGGMILAGPLKGTAFGAGGSVYQYDYGFGNTTAGSLHTGGTWQDSTEAGGTGITSGDAARHWFARVGYDINEDTQVFFEYMGAWEHSIERCCWVYYQTGIGPFYTSNPYIPASVLAQAQANNVSSFSMGLTQRFTTGEGEWGGLGANNYRYTDMYVVGGKGKFTLANTAWSWNGYAQQGISGEDYNVPQTITANMNNAIQAVRVGSYGPGYTAAAYPNPRGIAAGTITCASNLLPLASANATSNCIPYNVFGTGVVSQAAVDYSQGTGHLRQTDTTSILGASITGEPFNDWAGPVSVALDAEYRHEISAGYADPISAYAGYFSQNFYPVLGSQDVIEGAAETVVPLLKDKPFAQAVDFNGAVRETKYSKSGRVTTWKLGLEWTPVQDIRFRGAYSFDIRAPNLSNLFGLTSSHGTTPDPFFNNVAAPSFTNTIGNPDLQPEKSHQVNIGLVFQPTFIDGLHFSADWYQIKIAGAITTLTGNYELQDCYGTRIGTSYTGTSPYCPLVLRNPDNSLYGVEVEPFNIASFKAQGIDYQLDYRRRLDRFVDSWVGTAQLSLALTNTRSLITNTGNPGPTEILEGAGYGNSPKWQGIGTFSYDLDPVRFVVTEHYVGKVNTNNVYIQCSTNCPSPIPAGFQTINYDPNRGTYFTTDISAQYKFWAGEGAKNGTFFVSVDNLLNRDPPWSRNISSSLWPIVTNTSLYNIMGLYVRAGVRFRF